MNLERLFKLAEALGWEAPYVRISLANECTKPEHKWRVCLDCESGGDAFDYGVTPEAGVESLIIVLTRRLEEKAMFHECNAAKYRSVLLPGEGSKP